MVELAVEHANGKRAKACVMHANVPEEANALKERILSQLDCDHVEVYGISAAVGVHVGPGALGLAVYPL